MSDNSCPKKFDRWEQALNTYRGMSLVAPLGKKECTQIFRYIAILEQTLDEADCEDAYGTEGWRHSILGEDS